MLKLKIKSRLLQSKPTPVQPSKPSATGKYKIEDDVIIKGELYVSSDADKSAGHASNRTTKITKYVEGAKHPYNTTNDLGWMKKI